MPFLPDGADEDAAADPTADIDDRNTADRRPQSPHLARAPPRENSFTPGVENTGCRSTL